MDSPPAPNRLRSIARSDRPQERLERLGASALSDTELLAMLLRSGTRGQDVLTLAARLLAEAGSLSNLITWDKADFKKLKGIGHIKALQLLTVMELARRILIQGQGDSPLIKDASDVYRYLRPISQHLRVEKFWAICLSQKNRIIKCVEITSGIASRTLVHPREVFRTAMNESASALICAHNHPSGDPTPSQADITATRTLYQASKIVEIPLLDHVIIGIPEKDPGGNGYYSCLASGLIA